LFFYLKKCRYLFSFVVSPCDNNPCENNGTCSVDVNGNATCTCDGNWNGTYCQGNHILCYQLAMYELIFLTEDMDEYYTKNPYMLITCLYCNQLWMSLVQGLHVVCVLYTTNYGSSLKGI
jgi:hypothetical protein